MRIAFVATLVATAIFLGDAVQAQQAEPVVVANQIVARVRDKGDCTNVFQRAAKVQQRITETISLKQAGTPQLSLKQEDERWCIYNYETMLIRIWPEDAAPQNIDELSLAQMWLKNFERELPNAEPFRFKFAREGAAAYERPIKPAAEVVPEPGNGNPEPAANNPPTMMTQLPKRSTELLVVLDSFEIIRTYSKEEYEAKKDVLGQRLIERLMPFILGTVKTMEPRAPAGTPLTSPAPSGATPRLSPGTPSGPPPVPDTLPTPTPTEPVKTAGPPSPAAPPPLIQLTPPAPSGTGDAYARVPQKERIRRKMSAVRQPLSDMKERGDPQADRIGKLLGASRSKFYSGEFNASEEAVDAALKILGLEVK